MAKTKNEKNENMKRLKTCNEFGFCRIVIYPAEFDRVGIKGEMSNSEASQYIRESLGLPARAQRAGNPVNAKLKELKELATDEEKLRAIDKLIDKLKA